MRLLRNLTACVLFGTALGLALAAAGLAHAAPRIGSFAWSYKNRPVVAPLNGYEYVALSPRGMLAPGVVDSLKTMGAQPIVWLQPVVATAAGLPISGPDYPWDTALLALARQHNAILTGPNSQPVELFPGATYGAWVLDYRDTVFVDSLAALIVQTFDGRMAGVLWDFGCGSLAWANLAGVDPAIWPAWQVGFTRLVQRVREQRGGGIGILQCDQWPVPEVTQAADGAFFEQAGMSLNPLAKVWANVNRYPGKWTFVRVEEIVPQKRRAFATLCLLTGSRLNWNDLRGDFGGGTKVNYPDLEHFGMSVGPTSGAIVTKAPGVYARSFSRGVAVLNASAAPYVYALTATVKYTIQSGDGLVMQTRDERGRYIKRITNEGR